MLSYKVLGLGCAAVDTIINCTSLPEKDGFSLINNEKNLCGGCCANTLHSLTNLGVNSSYIGKIGDDTYGNLLLKDFSSKNINTKNIIIKVDGTTLHTFITVDSRGDKCIFSNVGDTLLNLSEDDVNEDILDDIDIFFTDMFPSRPSIKIAKMCRNKGIPVIFNLQCNVDFMKGCNTTLDEINEIIGLSKYFITNKSNFISLIDKEYGKENYNKAVRHYSRETNLIITDGEKPTLWASNEIKICETFNVDSIDSTGAGDAFLAGLIFSREYKKDSIDNSLTFANACAAIKCTQNGPRANFNYSDVLNFILNNKSRRSTQ